MKYLFRNDYSFGAHPKVMDAVCAVNLEGNWGYGDDGHTARAKDRIREVCGLPDAMVYRQPFPGPGLGVRCTGAITRDRLEAVREADAIVREEIGKMESLPWQYFVAIPDVKSTGIKDGKRYMGWAAVIRAINTVDAVTAESVEIPFDMLCRMRDRIIAEVPGINRVLWDISDKPVATIEWE